MYMVEFSEDKVCDLYEHIEKGLKYIGKAMQCIEELKSKSEKKGHRDWEDEEDEERFGDRGSRRGMRGRYSRY